MMNAILDGRPFKEAITVGHHDDVRSLWQKFIGSSEPLPKRSRVSGATFRPADEGIAPPRAFGSIAA
jgi:hypothetical protein